MLPDNLFLNLINLNLQKKIADSEELDLDATEALKLLLGSGPSSMQNSLNDWTVEDFKGKNILFYKRRNYIPKDWNFNKK